MYACVWLGKGEGWKEAVGVYVKGERVATISKGERWVDRALFYASVYLDTLMASGRT